MARRITCKYIIEWREFLDSLSDCQILEEDFAPSSVLKKYYVNIIDTVIPNIFKKFIIFFVFESHFGISVGYIVSQSA